MKKQLEGMDATAQAMLVRRREVEPIELVEAAIERIGLVNPKLNAVITTSFERAHEQARSSTLPDGPFRGVPFLLKDLGAHSAGDPFHLGMSFLKRLNWTEAHDTYVAQRFKAAGFVILGKTNTPELGLLPTTEPMAYGPTRNPWDPTRTAGGSSGGAAAAVAARMVPAAHATDGGGSIRIPAAHCGLVGLKPSRGRVSMGPFMSEGWGGFSAQNCVTHSVRDTAAILDAIAGVMPGDPYCAPAALRPYAAELDAAPGRLRIGCLVQSPSGAVVHPECMAAVERAAKLLSSLGHHVEEAYPEALIDPAMGRSTAVVIACSAARALDAWAEKTGRTITADDVEPATWAFTEISRGLHASDYVTAIEYAQRKTRDLAAWWSSGFDLLLTPTTSAPAPLLGYFDSPDDPFETLARAAMFSTFTSTFNASGQPAISLPVHESPEGLPVGVQLVAAYGREDLLIRIAAQVEAECAWAQRLPRVHA